MTAPSAAYAADGAVTLTVRGNLDAETVPDFQHRLQQAIASLTSRKTLIVDLRELDVLTVAGARSLQDAAQACTARSVQCYFVADPATTARTVLDSLRTTAALEIIDDSMDVIGRKSPTESSTPSTGVPMQRPSPAEPSNDRTAHLGIARHRAPDGPVRLAVSGEVELDTASELAHALREAITDDAAAAGIIVDLAGVTFLDSTEIRTLVNGHTMAQARGTTLHVVSAQDGVARVLEITGVRALLTAPDAEAAIPATD